MKLKLEYYNHSINWRNGKRIKLKNLPESEWEWVKINYSAEFFYTDKGLDKATPKKSKEHNENDFFKPFNDKYGDK